VKLVYECDQCGACCVHFSVHVNDDDCRREPLVNAAASRLPLKLADDTVYLNWDYEEGCPLLSEYGGCTVHLTKPDVCRRFPAGNPHCQWARGKSGLGTLQPTKSNA
jgi:Fe-S-cluster containining protein